MPRPLKKPESFTPSLRDLKTQLFSFHYTPRHRVNYYHFILSQPNHPLYPVFERRYEEREKAGIWWSVASGQVVSGKKVVRSWVARRLRTAFVEELKERGYSRDGKVIQTEEKASEEESKILRVLKSKRPMKDLKGSLRIQPLPVVVTAKYADIKKEMGTLVDELAKNCSQLEDEKVPRKLKALSSPPTTTDISSELTGSMRMRDSSRNRTGTKMSKPSDTQRPYRIRREALLAAV